MQLAVDELAAALDRAVLVEDPRHQPLWWSAQDAVDGTRLRTILLRSVDPAAVALVARLGLAKATGPVRTPALPEAEMDERWCVPLRAEQRHLGYLWVLDHEGVVTEQDLLSIVAVADQAAAAVARRAAVADDRASRRDQLIGRLVRGPDPDAATELTSLEHLDPVARVVVRAPGGSGGWAVPGDLSVHVVGSSHGVATSGLPVLLADLHLAVERAELTRRVLRAGARLPRPSWDALGAWRLIGAVPETISPADVHEGADRLADDARSDLLVTAWTVLELGGDVARSAAELHIHRTTLYYRLDRIAEVTGVDLRTGADRLDLHLALRLAAYRRAATP